MSRFSEKDFPAWASEIAGEALAYFLRYCNEIDSADFLRGQIEFDYPYVDTVFQKHLETMRESYSDWCLRGYKLLSDETWARRSVWEAIVKERAKNDKFPSAGLFYHLAKRSYILEEEYKEDLLIASERSDLHVKIRQKLIELSSLLAKSRYDFYTPQFADYSTVEHDDDVPLSIALAGLIEQIEQEVQGGNYKDRVGVTMTPDSGADNESYTFDFSSHYPPLLKNTQRLGHRKRFIQQFAKKLVLESHGRCPASIVAATASILFDDLPEVSAGDVSKRWRS